MTLKAVGGTLGVVGGTLLGSASPSPAPSVLDSAVMGWKASDYSGSGALLDFSGGGRDLTLHPNFAHQAGGFFQTVAGQGSTPAATTTSMPETPAGFTYVSAWGTVSGTQGSFGDASQNWAVTGWLLYLGVGPSLNADLFESDYDPYYSAYQSAGVVPAADSSFSVALRLDADSSDILVNGTVVQSTPVAGITWSPQLATTSFGLGANLPANAKFYGAAQYASALSDAEVAQVGAALIAP